MNVNVGVEEDIICEVTSSQSLIFIFPQSQSPKLDGHFFIHFLLEEERFNKLQYKCKIHFVSQGGSQPFLQSAAQFVTK